MSKPTTIPQWDSNLTNTVPLVSGHMTDGFALDEVPTSGELNEWMNLVYQWTNYYSNNTVARTIPVPLSSGVKLANMAVDAALPGSHSMIATGAWHWESPDAGAWGLSDGDEILTVTMRMKSVNGDIWNLSLYKQDNSTAAPVAAVVQTTSLTCGTSTGTTDVVLTITTPAAISAHDIWFIVGSGGATGDVLQGVWVTVNRP